VVFNTNKGSIPVRSGISPDPFDAPAKQTMKEFSATSASGSLLPSVAHEMAVDPAIRGAMFDVVTNFYNSDMSSEDAAAKLAEAVKGAKM
jgi:glucose/mannose transport system substrate-binding protein